MKIQTSLIGAVLALAGLALLLLTLSPPAIVVRPLQPVATGWVTWSPALASLHTDLAGYDPSCIVRLEDGQVTMVACPDGRVGWFDFRTAP